MEVSRDQNDVILTSLLSKCREAAAELTLNGNRVTGSFIIMNSNTRVVRNESFASEVNKHIAIMKAAVVLQEKTDEHLKDPHDDFGSCGPIYVMCGCLLCDFNMLCGSMCCTERLNLMGAVPVRQSNGGIGALSVATSTHDYRKEKDIAVASLTELKFKDVDGVWTHPSICEEETYAER